MEAVRWAARVAAAAARARSVGRGARRDCGREWRWPARGVGAPRASTGAQLASLAARARAARGSAGLLQLERVSIEDGARAARSGSAQAQAQVQVQVQVRRLLSSSARSRARVQDPREQVRERNRTIATWGVALTVIVLGGTYASVPLYRMFCQVTGFGGTVMVAKESDSGDTPQFYTQAHATEARTDAPPLKIYFTSDCSAAMPWKFRPLQREAKVFVGETALAFYNAKNKSDEAITGVATYNIAPAKAGIYFNKIQCFCFEEQRLNAQEDIDMPVFFFIDPEFLDDPRMRDVTTITLSYTFFRAEDVDPSVLQAQAASAWTVAS